MQAEDTAVPRFLPQAIREICREEAIQLTSFSDDWLHLLEKDNSRGTIIGSIFSLNNHAAAHIATDKAAAYSLLSHAGIHALPHIIARSRAGISDEWKREGWDKIVLKPIDDHSGHGVRLFDSADATLHWLKQTDGSWVISPFVSIAREIRLVVLDQTILIAYEKLPSRQTKDSITMFNLGHGAAPRIIENPESDIVELALQTQKTLGLRLAAIDVIELESGKTLILEVNCTIGMERFSRFHHANRAIAKETYRAIITAMMHNKTR